MNYKVAASALLLIASVPAVGQVGRIVRIPTPSGSRCINAKTDEITMTLRYIKTQKTAGFFTDDHKAGATVITTLNSDGNTKAQNPSVSLVDVQDAPAGQVYLPLEYPIASLLPLSQSSASQSSSSTFTKNMLLELYLDKVRGANSFGKVLDTAGTLLSKLPIPANPYTNAVSQVVNFATATITQESKDAGGQLFAAVTLQFNDRDESDIKQCESDSFETTGAIAVVGSHGAHGATLLPLDKLQSDYCWSYVSDRTYEVQYAPRPNGGCDHISPDAFKDVPNDYVMILVSAATVVPPGHGGYPGPVLLRKRKHRDDDLLQSKKLCGAMKLKTSYCGVI